MNRATRADHLRWTADRALERYRAQRAAGDTDAAHDVLQAIRRYLTMRDDTTAHPGARRLAAWLWSARGAGRLDGFEDRVAEFLRPELPAAPPADARPAAQEMHGHA